MSKLDNIASYQLAMFEPKKEPDEVEKTERAFKTKLMLGIGIAVCIFIAIIGTSCNMLIILCYF